MNLEIERKFFIRNTEFKKLSFQKKHIIQGFLNSDKNRVVRVRVIDNKAFITIKGISDKTGTTRFEWEKEILLQDAKNLIALCEGDIIEKNRYYHKLGNHIIEIDEFLGKNEGLQIAEIELKDKNEVFLKPSYLGFEITGEEQYYNSNLSKSPFKNWK
tara:strand:+ start:41290 stop:41763 length:474 start_codon:yes stop_codon:yes gene_type:complete